MYRDFCAGKVNYLRDLPGQMSRRSLLICPTDPENQKPITIRCGSVSHRSSATSGSSHGSTIMESS